MSRVLLTGASGRLGTSLRQRFTAARRPFLATDIALPADAGPVQLADLADPGAVARLFAPDISAVVHFGGISTEAAWDTILRANIVGTYNIFECARKAGVRRIIYASSYHVHGMYPMADTQIGTDADLRPDSLYAVSKIFGEGLSRLYHAKFGIDCLAIRICSAGLPGTSREARLWCNHDDLGRLVDSALDMPDLGHRTVFGISANDGALCFNVPDTDLGWLPQHRAAEVTPLAGAPLASDDPRNLHLGGIFPIWGHPDD